jgi:DNA-binding response OmpR family regulator
MAKQSLLEIRKRPNFNKTKIIIISTSKWELDIEYCLTNGANEYFIKPNCIEELKSYIKSTCTDLGSYKPLNTLAR